MDCQVRKRDSLLLVGYRLHPVGHIEMGAGSHGLRDWMRVKSDLERTLRDYAMPIDAVEIKKIHDAVRAYFKGAIKSGNKVFDVKQATAKFSAGDEKSWEKRLDRMMLRNQNSDKADQAIALLRQKLSSANYSPLQYGEFVMRQRKADTVGNCEEMAKAAASLVTAAIGTAWIGMIGPPGDHAFCLVNHGRDVKPDFVKLFQFASSDSWIIDPWANVCCPIKNYPQNFTIKMKKWKSEFKFIIAWSDDLKKNVNVDPASDAYLNGIYSSRIRYVKAIPEPAQSACSIL